MQISTVIIRENGPKSQIRLSHGRIDQMTVKCPACQKEVPDDSTFCLSCGRPLKADGMDMILPPEGSNTEGRALMYFIGAIMCIFFGGFLLIPGIFVGLGLIIPALCVVVIGFVFLAMRYSVLRRYAKNVAVLRKEASVKVKCSYCGTLCPEGAVTCDSCGARL